MPSNFRGSSNTSDSSFATQAEFLVKFWLSTEAHPEIKPELSAVKASKEHAFLILASLFIYNNPLPSKLCQGQRFSASAVYC